MDWGEISDVSFHWERPDFGGRFAVSGRGPDGPDRRDFFGFAQPGSGGDFYSDGFRHRHFAGRYGFQGAVQLSTVASTANSVTATGWMAAAGTTFCVKNPGYHRSNTLTVPVTAQSSAGGSSSAPAAPVLTAVTRNPLSVGTWSVTVTGTGFQPGAMLYDSYGSNNMIQYSASSVTPTSLTASIYRGSATTSTFCVKNPGSPCSNSIAVPVTGGSSGGTGTGGGPSTYSLTVVNGTVTNPSSSVPYVPGTTIAIAANAPPASQSFQSWTGATVANPLAASTTLTMPSANTTVTATYYTPTAVPFPVTSHPRLWITPADLPRLQSWATSGNVAYNGLGQVLGTVIQNYHQAFPGAALNATNPTPASPYPDFGDTQGYTGMLSEENAFILAFQSLIDPSARNLLMYAMNQAALGHQSNTPFRDPPFITYNRGSFTGTNGRWWWIGSIPCFRRPTRPPSAACS
jgi:hypothetical protein